MQESIEFYLPLNCHHACNHGFNRQNSSKTHHCECIWRTAWASSKKQGQHDGKGRGGFVLVEVELGNFEKVIVLLNL